MKTLAELKAECSALGLTITEEAKGAALIHDPADAVCSTGGA